MKGHLRIIGGRAKGRSVRVPASARPTGARLRSSLFELLAARKPPPGHFLDLYAGSGVVGLEAASRGYQVTLVERDREAGKVIEANLRYLGLQATLLRQDAVHRPADFGPVDIAFLDPPYQQEIAELTDWFLAKLQFTEGAILIVQHPTQLHLGARGGRLAERREYGSNCLTLYQSAPQVTQAQPPAPI